MQQNVNDNIRDTVIGVIEAHLGDAVPSASHFLDLGLDSLDVIEIVCSLEERFQVSIPNDEMITITNVDEAVKCIQNKIKRA